MKARVTAKERCEDKVSVPILRERLSYDEDTGVLRWKVVGKRAKQKVGDVAGGLNVAGYLRIKIDGVHVYAHRVAWAIKHGVHPDGFIDHIDGVKTNNRLSNLRVVNYSQSQINRAVSKNNSSGFRGVNWNGLKQKWAARCAFNGKRVHLGYFDNIVDAVTAYKKAAETLHGNFMRQGV